MIARDYITNVDYSAANINLIGSQIKSSAYSVIHEIDGVLRSKKLLTDDNKDATYEYFWKNPNKTRQTIARFHIKNK